MRCGFLYWTCIGSAALAFSVIARTGGALPAAGTSARRVTIDGRCFLAESSSRRETPSLRLELERLRVPFTEGIEIAPSVEGGHPVYRETLRPSADQPVQAKLPPGLKEEHAIRLEAEGGSVELVFGRTASDGQTGIARLRAEGWTLADQEENVPGPRTLFLARGKETAVVCLDETDRTFLLVRKMVR